ncbi:hypothetical protein EBR11_00715 [bacterium]|nr:hypothetical protein [bacterium]
MRDMDYSGDHEKARLLTMHKIVSCRRLFWGSVVLNLLLGIFLWMQSIDLFAQKKSPDTLFISSAIALILSFVVSYNIYEALTNHLKISRILQQSHRS